MRRCTLYDSHMHTTLCKHAQGTTDEYAAEAVRKGLRGIIFTCHNPIPDWHPEVRMDPEELPLYVELVQATRERWQGKVDVLLGLESDYCPGMEDYLEKLHAKADFNFILGSVHPHLPTYQKRYFTGSHIDFFNTYFEHLAAAAETQLFHSLAHPDLVKNCFPESWAWESVAPAIYRSLDRIAKVGTAMELNTSGLNKRIQEMNPGMEILREIRKRGIPITLGSDAHVPHRVGSTFAEALVMVREAGFQEISYFVRGERLSIPLGNEESSS